MVFIQQNCIQQNYIITPHLPKRKTNAKRKLTPIDQVLIALQFYATGTFQTTVGNVLRLSQASVSRAVRDVSLALVRVSNTYICFPGDLVKVHIIVNSRLLMERMLL